MKSELPHGEVIRISFLNKSGEGDRIVSHFTARETETQIQSLPKAVHEVSNRGRIRTQEFMVLNCMCAVHQITLLLLYRDFKRIFY